MKRFLVVLLSALCLISVQAADLPELAPGLRYLRVHSLEQSSLEVNDALNVARHPALVLDLRYVADEKGAADVINALNNHPAKPVLYILVSPETPEAVAAVIKGAPVSLVTLGIPGSQPKPKVEVTQSAADDRAAYSAFDNGTPLATLVSGKITKEHFDEAELVKEFKSGNHDARPPEGNADATPAPGALTDRVLQRALQLHLALQALKR